MTIIPLSATGLQSHPWQWHLQHAVRDITELRGLLGLSATDLPAEALKFPILVPKPFVSRMRQEDPEDPLLQQILPTAAEALNVAGFTGDPLAEQRGSGPKGLIQKYQGRVLVITTGSCAVNCRYCFRRHFPYQENRLSPDDWQKLIDHIANDDTIAEVIFSGGDPLMISDERLSAVTRRLADIRHVKTIRFHTRLPVVIPQRINDELLDWVSGAGTAMVFVMHINHPQEIDDELHQALARLNQPKNITLLNQSVLLKGINDRQDILVDLSSRLFAAGVLPYYLHLLDPVAGAAHFDVPESRGRQLIEEISATLPGYLVPRLAREEPGASSKTVIA